MTVESIRNCVSRNKRDKGNYEVDIFTDGSVSIVDYFGNEIRHYND